MVMLKIVAAPISIPLFQTSAHADVIFLQTKRHGLPYTTIIFVPLAGKPFLLYCFIAYKNKEVIMDYQLEIKQIVNYPLCRIHRSFIRRLMQDVNIRTYGRSYLFYYIILCSFANFRTSNRRLDSIFISLNQVDDLHSDRTVRLVSQPVSTSAMSRLTRRRSS